MLAGGIVCREAVRLANVDLAALYDRHAAAARVGGVTVFVLGAVVNGAVIAYCVWLATRDPSRQPVRS